jgi:hypothetical protein
MKMLRKRLFGFLISLPLFFLGVLCFFMVFGSFVVWALQGFEWLYSGDAQTYLARTLMCEIFECPSGNLTDKWVGVIKIVNFLLNLNLGGFLLIVGGLGLFVIIVIFHKLANLGLNFDFVLWDWGRSK